LAGNPTAPSNRRPATSYGWRSRAAPIRRANIDYVIEACRHVAEHADQLTGYRMVEEPPTLRHFTAKFERWPEGARSRCCPAAFELRAYVHAAQSLLRWSA